MTKIQIRKARDGWRWRAIRGGRIVAESGEGYTERRKCVAAITNLAESFATNQWSCNER